MGIDEDAINLAVEDKKYCTDILVQVSAINAALNAFNKELLANHIRTCVADDIRAGKDETIDELVTTLQKLMKQGGEMDKYSVSGMSCAACSARVEKAVSALENVNSCNVNLLTNSMSVDGNASEDAVIEAVKNSGYGA